MAFFDMPLEKLRKFRIADREPADFDAFWKRTLRQTAAWPLDAVFEPVRHAAYKLVDVYDVTFRGFGGQQIKGWFLEPAGNKAALGCLVQFIGYGGGRSLPADHVGPCVAGFAHFVMDTRGQGSGWSPGATGDDAASGPQQAGWMTRGIESPDTYYYRRVFTDAVRAVEAAASHPHVDARRIGVFGGSQGGGITIAAAALAGGKVKLAMPDVPFLCGYRRAVSIVDTSPYSEITQYLKTHRGAGETAFGTLAYFDGVNLAKRIKARCLFSVALMDTVCPPSTVFAAYNNIKSPKQICVYDYNHHEGGGVFHTLERMAFAAKWL
jgi:cephalosporin-C deacetylase